MARRALCLSVCAVMDELGSSRIAASWVGVFDLTPVLFPRNTPCSCGKHLSGQAACPERTGEEVLSEGEFLEGKTGPFLLPLCSKEEEVGIAVPSLPHRGLWVLSAVWKSEPERNLLSALRPPTTLQLWTLFQIIPKRKGGDICWLAAS